MNWALAIESSCDETALALGRFDDSGAIYDLTERISSQVKLHASYGGVVPELAAREHLAALPILLAELLAERALQLPDLAVIGVTVGPGLKGCLLMGAGFARALALANDTPLLGIHHIEGHISAGLLDNPDLKYPFLTLVVSGGHTELVAVEGLGSYRVVGATLDDAAGEAFDKSANLLGFEYPGGAKLAQLADKHGPASFSFPIALKGELDFSFSGLKTAILVATQRRAAELSQNQELKAEFASAIQQAIVKQLVEKTAAALKHTGYRKLLVTGGVAANTALRQALQSELATNTSQGNSVYFPKREHCTDNGAMILQATVQRFVAGKRSSSTAELRPRWPIEELSLAQTEELST